MRHRLPCLVCGRLLAVERSGLVKPHKAPGTREPYKYCCGTGYRHARWEAGHYLRHHSGDLWLVIGDVRPRFAVAGDDYRLRCVAGREKGREMSAHAEYMHRHGWTLVGARTAA